MLAHYTSRGRLAAGILLASLQLTAQAAKLTLAESLAIAIIGGFLVSMPRGGTMA